MPSRNKADLARKELTNALELLPAGSLLGSLLRRCSPDFLRSIVSVDEAQVISAEAADLATCIEELRRALLRLLEPTSQGLDFPLSLIGGTADPGACRTGGGYMSIDLSGIRERNRRRKKSQVKQDIDALIDTLEQLHVALHTYGRHQDANTLLPCQCGFDAVYHLVDPLQVNRAHPGKRFAEDWKRLQEAKQRHTPLLEEEESEVRPLGRYRQPVG